MVNRRTLNLIFSVFMVTSLLLGGVGQGFAQTPPTPSANSNGAIQPAPAPMMNDELGTTSGMGQMRTMTPAMRMAAAANQKLQKKGASVKLAGVNPATAAMSPLSSTTANGVAKPTTLAKMSAPLSPVDYFGVANWANSPLPAIALDGTITGGMRKFIDPLPGLCNPGSALGPIPACSPTVKSIPLGVANVSLPPATTFPGSEYYEIAVVQYREVMHSDLPATGTLLRGYVQLVPSTTPGAVDLGTTASGVVPLLPGYWGAAKPSYLGPTILAKGCDPAVVAGCTPTPVRVKFTNLLPTGPAGNLFIPMDNTYMGAGMGPGGSIIKINISNTGGAGYTSAPTVAFSAPPPGGTVPVATATIANAKVVDITITDGGSGYTAAPTVTLNGGGFTTRATAAAVLGGTPGEMYTQNRATLHLHGGNTPWISDGTPHQWTTPKGELTSYSKGVSVSYVPDMWFNASGNLLPNTTTPLCTQGTTTCLTPGATNDPGAGSLTFYWTNQQSGRLMFYHDHAYGITRLNVYAGEAAGYLLIDPAEEDALAAATVPGTVGSTPATTDLAHLVPLVIQDKTFVPDNGVAGGQLALTDPTWQTSTWGTKGNLWFPHVYIPNQNPADFTGANAFGRWDYGAWFWPAQDPSTYVPSGQPYPCTSAAYTLANPPAFPPLMCPGTPNPSGVPESFMDTPLVNGTAYPTVTVDPNAYRFQILSAGNDRTLNLGLYVADPLTIGVTNGGSGYVITPTVTLTPANGAVAVAHSSTGSVTEYQITNVGHGYITAPNVTVSGDGTGATAKAFVDPITGTISAVKFLTLGTGYTTATAVIDPPAGCSTGCVTATANAIVTPPGVVLSISVTNPGTGFTTPPAVTISAPTGVGGVQATAVASVNAEVKMVDAVPHTLASKQPLCNIANPTSGAMLALAIQDANSNPLNNTGLPANCYPTTWPTDGRDGGVPDPLTAGPPIVEIGTEGGLLPSPVVIPSTPVGYEYNRRSITVLNIFAHGLTIGPAERAEVVVDFSKFAGKTLIVYNDAPAPVPAFDPRNDYYTGDPDQSSMGGAPTTLPGYGPNNRTIMQIKVNATVLGPANLTPFSYSTLTTQLPNIFAAREEKILVPQPAYPVGNGNSAQAHYSRIQDTSMPGWFGGAIGGLTLQNGGTGFASAPAVIIGPPQAASGGIQATASATFSGAVVNSITLGVHGAGYSSAPAVTFTGGGGTGAAATATASLNSFIITNGGSGYTAIPTVTISVPPAPGVRATATATLTGGVVTAITLGNPGSGYTSAPTVTISASEGVTARASARLTVTALTLTNGGAGYTSPPTVGFTGGGTPTTAATATATFLPGTVTSLTLTNAGYGYTAAPTVTFNPSTFGAVAIATPPLNPFEPKAIQELFTLDYGRMNATLGVELPFTNFNTQTTIPYGYIDPPTEILKDGETQIWKITHNGVDTHFIHFHLFNVQVINRVGWDGAIKPPDANELSWKDTVRMNPLEDIIVALRPMKQTLPWSLPNSIRPLDVTAPIGSSGQFAAQDPLNQPVTILNAVTNFGYEYVWHCHILGHEENDMMRAMAFAVAPAAPSTLAVTGLSGPRASLTWTNNALNATGITIQRATNSGFSANLTTFTVGPKATSYIDSSVVAGTIYYYRVIASNTVGSFATGFPNTTVLSAPSNTAVAGPPAAPTNLLLTQPGVSGTPVVLKWTDNATNETNFTVQRATSASGPWVTITTAVPPSAGTGLTVTYNDAGVAALTHYWYRVQATNAFGASAFAPTANITTK